MDLLSFYDKVDFSATILARLMIMGQIIVVKGPLPPSREGRGATF